LDKGNALAANRKITKAEFTALLTRTFGLKSVAGKTGFGDVPTGHRYSREIAAARENQILETSAPAFFPDRTVTREGASLMVAKALNVLFGTDRMNKTALKTLAYTDVGQIRAGAKSAVGALAGAGLFKGFADRGAFSPQSELTVGEAAVLVNNIIENLIKR
jgi:hypothetical protein